MQSQAAAAVSEAVILSSSEFGKAYLAEGVSHAGIRHLMEHLKLVFVGYPLTILRFSAS